MTTGGHITYARRRRRTVAAPRAGVLLLPTIVAAGLLLAAKLGDLQHGLAGHFTAVAPAQAEEQATAAAAAPDEPATKGREHHGPTAAERAPGGAPMPLPAAFELGEIELLQRLRERRAALQERERRLELREAALETAETKLRAQIERLETLRAAVEAEMERFAAVEEARLQSLVKIYEKMKPKDAAAVFDRLEMPVLLAVIGGMRETKSAPVIAAMSPDRAEQLTRELARRHHRPSLEE